MQANTSAAVFRDVSVWLASFLALACATTTVQAVTRLSNDAIFTEEQPRTAITTVPADVTAIVGRFVSGPVDSPQRVTSFDEFTRVFGNAGQDAAAVRLFYENGGATLQVVRIRQWTPTAVVASLGALDAVPFQILLVPVTYEMDNESAARTIDAAIRLATDKGALYFIDVPRRFSISDVADFSRSRDSASAAIYYPALKTPWGILPPGSAIAGRVVRNDHTRGFWTTAIDPLSAVQGLPDGVDPKYLRNNGTTTNFIRFESGRGYRLQGYRTLSSNPELRYIPVVRTQQVIEQSIRKGLSWMESAPNDPRTWQESSNFVTDYLTTLWRDGVLKGDLPQKAFFVRCDRSTMTETDVAAGRTVILIGTALAMPTEFMLRKIVFTRK